MSALPTSRKRVAVAVSGGGRTLENLLACQKRQDAFEIVGVIASRPCRGVEIGQSAGLPVLTGADSDTLYAWLDEHQVDVVALAGYLKKFPLRPEWEGRIVNIHPALLPAYGGPGMYGQKVHEAVIREGAAESGATIHLVDEEYDRGRILAQIVVPVLPEETAESLAARIFAAECRLYPEALAAFCRGELPRLDGTVWRLTHGD